MVNTIDMKNMRYLNLFERITKVNTRFCFYYNNNIIFCVPKRLVSKAVGESGKNVKKISEILKKRIKIISYPKNLEDSRKFVEDIISPVIIKDFESKKDEIIITAGSQSKAALIGRNKRRFLEMREIIRNFFGKEFKIV